jgi:hypothetical protein
MLANTTSPTNGPVETSRMIPTIKLSHSVGVRKSSIGVGGSVGVTDAEEELDESSSSEEAAGGEFSFAIGLFLLNMVAEKFNFGSMNFLQKLKLPSSDA